MSRPAQARSLIYPNRGWTKEAHELLAPIYHHFTEGFEPSDLKAAKALIDNLR